MNTGGPEYRTRFISDEDVLKTIEEYVAACDQVAAEFGMEYSGIFFLPAGSDYQRVIPVSEQRPHRDVDPADIAASINTEPANIHLTYTGEESQIEFNYFDLKTQKLYEISASGPLELRDRLEEETGERIKRTGLGKWADYLEDMRTGMSGVL